MEGSMEATTTDLITEIHIPEDFIERVAVLDEVLFDAFIEGRAIRQPELLPALTRVILNRTLIPVFAGSAKIGIGIDTLLDAVVSLLPAPKPADTDSLSALVYNIGFDKTMGKVAHVKILSGSIRNRDVVMNATNGQEEKVTQVRRLIPGKFEDIGIVHSGDIAGICGLGAVKAGDFLGHMPAEVPTEAVMKTALLTVQVKALNEKDYAKLAEALQVLNEEDPMLAFSWLRDEQELHVNVMGWMQMEVIEQMLDSRFGINARLENPTVIYKETPSGKGFGFVQYWMPKPCWAILKFMIEPGERGSGVMYTSTIGVNDVKQKYQNEVERTIPLALDQGIKGWEVTDIRITLVEGEDHEMHSRPGDFVVATPMGIMQGLDTIGTTLLEPLISFKITAPESLLGAIASDITQMRGNFESPEMTEGRFHMCGILPVSTSMDYPVKLSSRSGGKAKISTKFYGYQPCTDEQGVIRPFKGISPLDTAKYILKARKALS
jgi:ribosomal protection tetracycline resistance protein